MTIPIRGKPIFHRMYYIVRNNHEEGCISPLQRPHYFTSSYTHNNFEKSDYCIVLQKINCTRQFESQLSLRSFALSFRVKDCLSALIHLIGFLNIVTWKHRLIVLIPIFLRISFASAGHRKSFENLLESSRGFALKLLYLP